MNIPVIILGATPATVTLPTAGVIVVPKLGATPAKLIAPVFGVTKKSVRSCGAIPAKTAAPTAGVII
jgi:hypothetical protein